METAGASHALLVHTSDQGHAGKKSGFRKLQPTSDNSSYEASFGFAYSSCSRHKSQFREQERQQTELAEFLSWGTNSRSDMASSARRFQIRRAIFVLTYYPRWRSRRRLRCV